MGEHRQRYNEEFKKQTVQFIQEQTKTVGDLAEELNIPKSTLHQWMSQYRELKNEPAASVDRVRELEAQLKEMSRQLQEKDNKIADVEEELAIVKKSSAHLQQTKELRFQFIEKHRSEFLLEKMCKALHVSRSGYYKWRTEKTSTHMLRKAAIMKRIQYHFVDHQKRYGSPKITRLLHQEGYTITERTVSVYMRHMKLRSIVSKTYRVQTTDSNHDHPIAPNTLNQQFKILKPNTVWVTDITYIPCRGGRLYLASVMDLCTREIVGWRLENHMETSLVLGALQDAYAAKQPEKGLLHHSDRGSQYTSHEYTKQLKAYGMESSMSRRANCYDNACIESWHSILKKELIYCNPRFKTKEQAYQTLFQYIEFYYNRKRMHGALGYLSPVRFAEQLTRMSVA